MVYRGTVKGGRVELDDGMTIPEGTRVTVEPFPTPEEWRKELEELAREVSQKWKSPLSAVEMVSEMRR